MYILSVLVLLKKDCLGVSGNLSEALIRGIEHCYLYISPGNAAIPARGSGHVEES